MSTNSLVFHHLSFVITLLTFSCTEQSQLPEPETVASFSPDPNTTCGGEYYECISVAKTKRNQMFEKCTVDYGFGGSDYYGCIGDSDEVYKRMMKQCKSDFSNCTSQ